MQKQPQLPYTMTLLVTTDGNGEAALPTERGVTAATLQRQREAGGQQPSPHPAATHAWLTSRSPHTASGQRREATAPVIASGHENGERDCGTAIGHSNPPGEHAKAAAVTNSGNSRDRSRQSGFGGAASSQKTATGPTETTRAKAMKPLAVRRPPTIAPRPHKGKQQTRRSTPTASRPLNRARKAERQREQQDRTREPFDQEWAQSILLAFQAEDREAREDPKWSGTRKTHPPHHLAERAEMRWEGQPRTEKSPRRFSLTNTSPSVQR